MHFLITLTTLLLNRDKLFTMLKCRELLRDKIMEFDSVENYINRKRSTFNWAPEEREGKYTI